MKRIGLIAAALLMLAAPALAQTQAVNGQAYTSTSASVTIATHGTFQNVLVSSNTRRGCLVQNTSTDTEFVFFGALASATTAASVKLSPGAAVNCNSGVIVAGDAVNITSQNTDGVTAMVVSQTGN